MSEHGYTPAKPKPMTSEERLRLEYDRGFMHDDSGGKLVCEAHECGGLVVNLKKGEIPLRGHTIIKRGRSLVAACQHAIPALSRRST